MTRGGAKPPVQVWGKARRFCRFELRDKLARMLAACPVDNARADLILLDDGEMAQLNAESTGLPGPTNILSFPSGEAEFLGELYLSLDSLEREAQLYGQKPEAYATRLLAHGLAHLLGHDHSPEMESLEAELREQG